MRINSFLLFSTIVTAQMQIQLGDGTFISITPDQLGLMVDEMIKEDSTIEDTRGVDEFILPTEEQVNNLNDAELDRVANELIAQQQAELQAQLAAM